MKKFNSNKTTQANSFTYFGIIGLLISLAWTNVHAGTVLINPAASLVGINDVFTVDIEARDFSQSIDGWGMDVSWDTSRLALESANVNTSIWNFISDSGNTSTAGSLLNIGGSRFGDVTGAFSLATLTFKAIAAGSTNIRLSITDDISDAFRWGNFGVSTLPDNTINGTVEISSVPLPAGAWLMLSGLSTLLINARRKQIA